MEQLDCVVIGAGVVGLAVARELALAGREVVVLEAADSIGSGASSRNSEVIHAGICYPPGSLKARLCVEGKQLLYDYCTARQVAHKRCGKLIVATAEAQHPALQAIADQALANGVDDLRWLTTDAVLALEPALRCTQALLSPSTGIVDSHGLMLALQGDAERAGAVLALKSPLRAGRITPHGIELEVGGDEPMSLRARSVVNSAGLQAQRLAAALAGFPTAQIPPAHRCKGSYFTVPGRAPFSRLVYPVPEAAGLGVHVTLDLGGQARFGPDVEWLSDETAIEAIDYAVDARRAEAFYEAIRRYWPALAEGALQPGHAGVRSKIQAQGEPAQDFVVAGPAQHGVAGLVHLFGIESPGLTAALALARRVAALLQTSPPDSGVPA